MELGLEIGEGYTLHSKGPQTLELFNGMEPDLKFELDYFEQEVKWIRIRHNGCDVGVVLREGCGDWVLYAHTIHARVHIADSLHMTPETVVKLVCSNHVSDKRGLTGRISA